MLPAFTTSPILMPLSSCPQRAPFLTASIHRCLVSFSDPFSMEMADLKVLKEDARKVDTPLSWNVLIGRELLEWQPPDTS